MLFESKGVNMKTDQLEMLAAKYVISKRSDGLCSLETEIGRILFYKHQILMPLSRIYEPTNYKARKYKGEVYIKPSNAKAYNYYDLVVVEDIADVMIADWQMIPADTDLTVENIERELNKSDKKNDKEAIDIDRVQRIRELSGRKFWVVSDNIVPGRTFFMVAFGQTTGTIKDKSIQVRDGIIILESPYINQDATYVVPCTEKTDWKAMSRCTKQELVDQYGAMIFKHTENHAERISAIHSPFA